VGIYDEWLHDNSKTRFFEETGFLFLILWGLPRL